MHSAAMHIAIVTDAWRPQVNGVVTTLGRTVGELTALGYQVDIVTPEGFRTAPLPWYPEIRVALMPGRAVAAQLESLAPQHIHIATEGSLGIAARNFCMQHGYRFTTSYHTQFPEYLRERLPVPLGLTYSVLQRFHASAARTMVATGTMRDRLRERGFDNLVMWERGVDTELFHPATSPVGDSREPVWIYVGRVAVEKNIEAFLRLDLPGTKQVVGDGPALKELQHRYPEVRFSGYLFGAELAAAIAAASVFVFPSLTDTFGLVMLEAMACGLPVAAFPVTGPIDVVKQGITGVLDNDLQAAAMAALNLDRSACRAEALSRTWRHATEQFAANLVPV